MPGPGGEGATLAHHDGPSADIAATEGGPLAGPEAPPMGGSAGVSAQTRSREIVNDLASPRAE